DYAFNKAHSAAYGVLSYWTAYLKAHYPAEYMAALLTSVKDDKDKMAIYLAECRRMGIKVLPPCVNSSDANFTPTGQDIRFDLFSFGAEEVTQAAGASDVFAVRVPDGEWDKSVLLNFEREMLGLYVSDHPLFGVEHVLRASSDLTIADVQSDAVKEGERVVLA